MKLNWFPIVNFENNFEFEFSRQKGESRVPNAMDGLPAPWSRSVNPEDSLIAKAIAQQVMEHDLLRDYASPYWRNDMVWYGSYGFGMAENYQEYSYFFVEALSKAFTNRELEVKVFEFSRKNSRILIFKLNF